MTIVSNEKIDKLFRDMPRDYSTPYSRLRNVYDRAKGILKNNKKSIPVNFCQSFLKEKEEEILYDELKRVLYFKDVDNVRDSLNNLATLYVPLTKFFHKVRINCEDENLKNNRLALLRMFIDGVNKEIDLSVLPSPNK